MPCCGCFELVSVPFRFPTRNGTGNKIRESDIFACSTHPDSFDAHHAVAFTRVKIAPTCRRGGANCRSAFTGHGRNFPADLRGVLFSISP